MSNLPIALYSSVTIFHFPLLPGRLWRWFAARNTTDNNVFCLVWSCPTTLKGHQREISKYFSARTMIITMITMHWSALEGEGAGDGSGGVNDVRDCQESSRIHGDDRATFYHFITSTWHFQPLLLLSPPSLVRLVGKKSWRKALRREFRPIVSNYACFIKGREDGLVGNHTLINRMSARATLSGRGNSKSAEFYPPPEFWSWD